MGGVSGRQRTAEVRNAAQLHTYRQVEALLAGTEFVAPGLGRAAHWQPPPSLCPDPDDEASQVLLGAVGRVPFA
ncbi:hypothetical protein FG385_08940 [Amycolatopsis alkalitolerans]|uniref:Uncharacterized protein n=1 Tax=Amycolatopsis alkalitolerans TaxID=2547244 RepID=A0A5C4M880_9PSEU|nr:hypothetical protein FG385_08940 [Amycolatopsis alkalitolerans]